MAYKFFDENNVPYKKVGKLIVAVEPDEVPRLDALYERAQKNGCRDVIFVEGNKIKEYEPYCKVVLLFCFIRGPISGNESHLVSSHGYSRLG